MNKTYKIAKLVALSLLSTQVMAQTASFQMGKLPIEVQNLIDAENKVKLSKLRLLCHDLTDDDITLSGKYPYPKRRKAQKRHVKHLCEDLELMAWQNKPLGSKHINHLFELNLLQKSIAEKAKSDALGMRFIDKIKMAINSFATPLLFQFKKKVTSKEAMNLNLSRPYSDLSVKELSQIDPVDSPYYTSLRDEEPYKRFKKIAKDKKIKTSDHMVLIFKGVSDSGSAPKIKTLDTNLDDEWSLKWGDELHTDVVGSRLFAALGFDVDHPYYREKNSVTLVFPKALGLEKDHLEMIRTVKNNFNIDIEKYVSDSGVVEQADVEDDPQLAEFIGLPYVRFVECALEGRPDRVKRLGPLMNNNLFNRNRRELRGALLAHLWIDNWDTRAENTMMAINHQGNHKYKSTGVFSDLGTSLGVKVNFMPVDFRVGLVNEFSWDIVKKKSAKKVSLMGQINAYLPAYRSATYADMRWMATKIAKISKKDLEEILDQSGWPKGLAKLYFHKLAARRAQILDAFEVQDPNPIAYDRHYSYEKNGITYIKNGVLIKDFMSDDHPLGYMSPYGRLRNYGGNK